MIRHKLLGNLKYINPLDPAVDLEAWPEDKSNTYFKDHFELPPLKDDGDPPVVWTIRQLTGREMFEVQAAMEQHTNALHPEVLKTILQYAIVGWSGIEIEDANGNIKTFEADHIDTPIGRRLKDENYYELIAFFTNGTASQIAGVVSILSRCR